MSAARSALEGDKESAVEGWGLYEHGPLGRHDPSGFADWLTVAL